MDAYDILKQRLANQHISSSGPGAEHALKWLGAVQAQDYNAALWAIGLRCLPSTKSVVETAVVERKITRTWLMRGTLHFAASADIAWMLGLFSPRLVRTAAYRDRHLGLTDEKVRKIRFLFRRALQGGKQLSRSDMYRVMEKGGVPSSNNLGYHMLYRAAWDGLICFGPHAGKEPTFVLAEEWLPKPSPVDHEQALAEIVTRYFCSHGPATVKDFLWWSGLTMAQARRGMEGAASKLREEVAEGRTYYMPAHTAAKATADGAAYLLPAFDEYLLGYADRTAVLGGPSTRKGKGRADGTVVHSNGIFLPVLVVDGTVAGVWKRAPAKTGLTITLSPFRKLSGNEMAGVREQVESYGRFFETGATLKV